MPDYDAPYDLDYWALIRTTHDERVRNYDVFFLRGINDMMERYKGRMSDIEAYKFAFNCLATTFVKKAKKPRYAANDGFLRRTGVGDNVEKEYRGWSKMSKERQASTGYNLSRNEMAVETAKKMKALDDKLKELKKFLPDKPPQQPGLNLV